MTDSALLLSLTLAYGKIACETRQAPLRGRFVLLARRRGIPDVDFAEWAKQRTWR